MARQTELYTRHVALGGRMIDFAGWLLPVQYPSGPIEEHHTVRKTAGLFDIDHMGQLVVKGPEVVPFLQKVLSIDLGRVAMGEARYALACYEDGGVVDDLFVYCLPDRYFIAINAANVEKDTLWFRYHAGNYQVSVENVSEETYMLALQGPRAEAILQQLTTTPLDLLPYHHAVESKVAGVPTLIGRTGYTGEDGFELFFPREKATRVWDRLMEVGEPLGMKPIGLAARDSLRFEAKMPLYGQEISAHVNPLQAGLGWAVAFEKEDWLGREALLKVKLEGSPMRLVGLEMLDRGVARHGYLVLAEGRQVGEVTSGMFAPTLGRYLALAYVPAHLASPGTVLEVQIRGEGRRAQVVPTPFYRPVYHKSSPHSQQRRK